MAEDRLAQIERILLTTAQRMEEHRVQTQQEMAEHRAQIQQEMAEHRAQTQQDMARLTAQTEANARAIEANARAIEANTRAIQDQSLLMSELREGQALLAQFFSQGQEDMREFRRSTKASLDRIDQTLEFLRGNRS